MGDTIIISGAEAASGFRLAGIPAIRRSRTGTVQQPLTQQAVPVLTNLWLFALVRANYVMALTSLMLDG
ncbi:hypothetical protein ACC740_17050 [Rhizobium ruizarguesonis]